MELIVITYEIGLAKGTSTFSFDRAANVSDELVFASIDKVLDCCCVPPINKP